jgi:hypothetical protein
MAGFWKSIFNRTGNKPSKLEGSDGVIASGGWIASDERSPDLDNPRARFTTFGNAINDSTVIAAAVNYMVRLVAGARWTITPNQEAGSDGDKAAKIITEGVIEAKTQQPWETTVGQAAMSPIMGFSLHEWAQRRRRDGMIVLGDIQALPQWTIARWDKGDDDMSPLMGVEQWVPGLKTGPKWLGRKKLLYVVDKKISNKPDGLGLLRHVIKKWKVLERYELLEAFGFEGDLRGIPYGKAPYAKIKQYALDNKKSAEWVKEQTSALRTFIENHIKNPGLGIILDSELYETKDGNPTASPKWALELMKGDGQGLVEIAGAIDRINREISRVLGMEFLMLGADGKGSLALSRDKTSMFATLLASTLSSIAWAVTYDVAWPLLEANGLDPELCAPKILPDPIATEDIEKVTSALVDLANAGAPLMPDDPVVDQVRQRLHLAEQPKLTPELLGALSRQRAGLPADPNAQQPPDPNAPTDPTPPVNSDGPDPSKGEVDVPLEDGNDPKRKAA